MVDRLINWGSDAADARYQTRDSDPAGGDFVVVNDTTGGGQLLMWDYSAGEWVYGGPVNMGGNDITNAGTVSATALEANTVDYNGVTPDYPITTYSSCEQTGDATTTSTSFVTVLDLYGNYDLSDIPDGMSLYGRFVARIGNDTGGETTTARPSFFNATDGATQDIDELQITATGGFEDADSGWVDLSSADIAGDRIRFPKIEGKVSGGTGTFNHNEWSIQFAGVSN